MLYLSPVHRVLRLSGPDALAFLQSQLTNDAAALTVGAWQWQGYCSAKGRLLATFALARTGAETWEAVVHGSTVEALTKRLTMFRMRSKVVIEIAADRSVAYAFDGFDAVHVADSPAASSLRLNLGQPDGLGHAYVLLDASEAATVQLASVAVGARWQRACIDAMQPEITASTVEMFVPQMIDWDTVQPGGGVSFSKGCYPGQEVVARAHYRGAVKRRLEKIALSATETPDVGTEITLTDGRSAEVCNVAKTGEHEAFALVVVSPTD